MSGRNQPDAPVLRVVKGDPTPEELAALVTVLAAHLQQTRPREQPGSAWSDRQSALRRPRPGASGWRATARPS